MTRKNAALALAALALSICACSSSGGALLHCVATHPRRRVSTRIALGRELLRSVRRLPRTEALRLARAIATFRQAHEAYVTAAFAARRLKVDMDLLARRLDIDAAAVLDAAAKDARDTAIEINEQDGRWPPNASAPPSRRAALAVERASRLERADGALWAPLVRVHAALEAARAKRHALVGLWEAAFRHVTSLVR